MSARKNLKKVKIDDIQTGMFVVKLDIPWVNSPFFKKSIDVKSDSDINKMRQAGVKMVLIDLDRSSHEEPDTSESISTPPPTSTDEHAPIAEKEQEQLAKPSLGEEMDAALIIRDRIKSTLNNIMNNIEKQAAVQTEELVPLVEDTIASLERNNQAFLNIAHLSKRSAKIADHTISTFCLVLNAARLPQSNIDADSLEALGFAALLHEAGWAQTPLDLMGKRKTYTDMENTLISRHVDTGLKLLTSSNLPELTLRIIAEHHELCDGSGYPNELHKDDLHPLSRLFRVVDSYDERVHQLLDRPGMLPTNALRTLYVDAEQGIYDSEAVSLLIASLGVYPVSSAVLLNTGEKALVIEVPEDNQLQPVIIIHYDANNRPLRNPITVDLQNQTDSGTERYIESVLDANNPLHDPVHKLHLTIH